ncbi:RagB/SusD family nutrient uptake outer membrane protein [Pedobacter caeni]|uniref:SusD family protein n=1 Tax=Pedobacter caeni TaxID=288992 RepID=A0A1M5JP20_9SPHI|nr:RagB/SusD family nutrient uptake outer membrane protein [Pedobacter caeni]SHG42332.1 SusD family protein [Pedobacter caeni]
MKNNLKYNKPYHILTMIVMIGVVGVQLGCQKFLDTKPNQKLMIINSLKDCQALLNNYGTMNIGYPNDGEAASDNYYLLPSVWKSLSPEDRDTYVWAPQGERLMGQWANPYKVVYNANLILQTEEGLPNETDQLSRNEVKGAALFFRAYAFHQLAQIFAPAYDPATASSDLGIALRLSPDLDVVTKRASVQQSYERILTDFQEAASLLPLRPGIQSKPSRIATFAALARTYLTMENYAKAGIYADSCLKYTNTLIDYKNISPSSNTPFGIFNQEVIFQSVTTYGNTLDIYSAKVDPDLMREYELKDLRRIVFFKSNDDGSYAFKGNYNGSFSSLQFSGLATDEMYLIRAECAARSGDVSGAMKDLNTLMEKRWDGVFTPFTADNADVALAMVLKERRKELLFRNLRWPDLRRLNKDSRFKRTLSRGIINGKEFTLPPNDLRYTLLIPQEIINKTGIQQNLR